jgi:flagellin
MEDADSSLRDADISEEMMDYAKNSILIQAGNAMMVQTNKFPQDILQILSNVKSR